MASLCVRSKVWDVFLHSRRGPVVSTQGRIDGERCECGGRPPARGAEARLDNMVMADYNGRTFLG
jgi:hypothetical protein